MQPKHQVLSPQLESKSNIFRRSWERLTDWDRSPVLNSIEYYRYQRAERVVEARVWDRAVKFEKFAVPALINLLKVDTKDPHDKTLHEENLHEDAADALFRIGFPAVPALVEALKCLVGDAKWRVFDTLVKIGPPTVPALVVTLRDPNLGVRQMATKALVEIGSPSVPKLIEMLLNNGEEESTEAVAALRQIKDPDTISAFISALKDKNFEIHRNAVKILGYIGDASAVSSLVELLKDPNEVPSVRWRVASALGEIKDASSVPALTRVMLDDDEKLREVAAESLEKIEVADPKRFTSGVIALVNGRFGDELLSTDRKTVELFTLLHGLLDKAHQTMRESET